MQARDVMTREIVTVRPETRVNEIARILTARRISGVPVVDSGDHVVGVVTEADLTSRPECGTDYPRHSWLARLVLSPEQSAADYTKTHGLHAADVMTSPPVTVREDTPVDEVAKVLDEKHIRRVPVVRGDRLVGIVSRADLLAGLARSKDADIASNAADQAIYDKLTEALKREPWGNLLYGHIAVKDGVVHLYGMVEADTLIKAFGIAAERTPGVKSVVNHLTRIESWMYYCA